MSTIWMQQGEIVGRDSERASTQIQNEHSIFAKL